MGGCVRVGEREAEAVDQLSPSAAEALAGVISDLPEPYRSRALAKLIKLLAVAALLGGALAAAATTAPPEREPVPLADFWVGGTR